MMRTLRISFRGLLWGLLLCALCDAAAAERDPRRPRRARKAAQVQIEQPEAAAEQLPAAVVPSDAPAGPTEREPYLRPAYLRAGDTVALVAPAAKIRDTTRYEAVCALFASWGLHVKSMPHLNDRTQPYFGASDAGRAADLQAALDDPSVKAIVAYLGGYGSVRLLSQVDFGPMRSHPKWLVGFSDITMLHLVMRRLRVESIHGPMPAVFARSDDGVESDESVESLRRALFGEVQRIEAAPHPMNRPGTARGRLVGGNLVLLTSAAGTPEALCSDEPCILVLEETAEAAYRIDRMMQQLLRSGALDRVQALVMGHFSKVSSVEHFGMDACQIIESYARLLDIPLLCGFPCGHELPNLALYLGREAVVEVGSEGAVLQFVE